MSETSIQSEVERVIEGAADALSDDIVARLGSTMGEGLILLDQVSHSNLDKAIPVINELVNSGDLERAASLMRVLGAAGDALGDDIVGRLGGVLNELLLLADRLANNENLHRLLDFLEQDDVIDTLETLCRATAEVKNAQPSTPPPATLMGLINTMKDPELQQSLQTLSRFAAAFRR